MSKSVKKALVLSSFTVAVSFLIWKIIAKQRQKSNNLHWQRSQEAKKREKEQRHAIFQSKEFPSDYKLTTNARALFIAYAKLLQQNIPTDEEILQKIKTAFEIAFETFPYGCIYSLSFAQSRIIEHPFYSMIKEKKDIEHLRFIDLGCCMGTEIRQLIVEGAKKENLLGIEIQQEYIDIGNRMFGDEPSFKERFIITNIVEDDLSSQPRLTSFLSHGVDVLYCGQVFHLFSEEDTYKLTKAIAKLLPSGALFVGSTGGSKHPTEPIRTADKETEQTGQISQFLHSVSTFQGMLQESGFINCKVQVQDRIGHASSKLCAKMAQNRGFLFWHAEKK